MGYRFTGVFTCSKTIALAAHQRWPFCVLKEVTEQSECFVLRIPVEEDNESEEISERIENQYLSVKKELVELSKVNPDEVVIFLEAECFGGVCSYVGFQTKNGVKLKEFVDFDAPEELLIELLEPINVSWTNGLYFAPLDRAYFKEKQS